MCAWIGLSNMTPNLVLCTQIMCALIGLSNMTPNLVLCTQIMCPWIGLRNMTAKLVPCTDYVCLDWFEQHDTRRSAVYTDHVCFDWFEQHGTKLVLCTQIMCTSIGLSNMTRNLVLCTDYCAWIGLSNMIPNLVLCTDYVHLDWFEQHDTRLSAVYTDYVRWHAQSAKMHLIIKIQQKRNSMIMKDQPSEMLEKCRCFETNHQTRPA